MHNRGGGDSAVGSLTDVEGEVLKRYAAGAQQPEPGLCCPVKYDSQYLDLIPQEILEKDYGCGDPSRFVEPGETVVDLGSGAGKSCYIIAQKVGPPGKVYGVDFNREMLSLARKYRGEIAARIGYSNVEFVKARIQDLALDLEEAERWLERNPVTSVEGIAAFEAECDRLRREQPLFSDGSVDVVVSNCVLNLVRPQDKAKLFSEIHRVLRKGGRAVISDIVSDEDPTPSILADPSLWSGCIAGAFREDQFLGMFEQAGFYGIELLSRQGEPWQTLEGIEFRSVTVRAYKGKEGPCLERNQAVIYKGPWRSVSDDDGHTFVRGQRMAVCDKTFALLTDPCGPYVLDLLPVVPREEVPLEQARPFNCQRQAIRYPRETKGAEYRATSGGDSSCACGPGEC